MSVFFVLNSKAVTWSVWGILAAVFAAMLLYENRGSIASYTNFAKPVPTANAIAADDGPGEPGPFGSAPMFW